MSMGEDLLQSLRTSDVMVIVALIIVLGNRLDFVAGIEEAERIAMGPEIILSK
jgi:hypothetical protein